VGCPGPPGQTRAAAGELDRRGIATLSGAKWSAMAVLRVRERLARSWPTGTARPRHALIEPL